MHFQVGMTKTDAAVQTLSDINPDVVLEVRFYRISVLSSFSTCIFKDLMHENVFMLGFLLEFFAHLINIRS